MDAPDALVRLVLLWKVAAPMATLVPLVTRPPGRPPLENTPEELLKSAERRRILDAIETAPGIHMRLLKSVLEMGGGEFDRNIDRLIAAGLIEKHRIANHTRLYPAGQVPPPGLEPLESGMVRRVARSVLDRPGITAADVAAVMGVSPSHARRWLRELADAKLARTARKGLQLTYLPTSRLEEAMKRYP